MQLITDQRFRQPTTGLDGDHLLLRQGQLLLQLADHALGTQRLDLAGGQAGVHISQPCFQIRHRLLRVRQLLCTALSIDVGIHPAMDVA